MPIERELKFHLRGAPPAPLARLATRRANLASIYYDTRDGALRRAGVALRVRRSGKLWFQTLKSEAPAHAGVATRSEWETPVPGKELELGALPCDEIRRATGVDVAALARRLRPVFETRFVRHWALIALDGEGEAELALDRGSIIAGERRETIRELELELKSGEPRALLRFAEGLGLMLAVESKAERGYRLASGTPEGPRKWRMPQLDLNASTGEAFAALFRAALAHAIGNVRGVIDSSDPEYLHQMRVGLRRLRAALRAFAPVIKGTRPLRRRLRMLKPLGVARDWDVFVQCLERTPAAPLVLKRSRARRHAARRAVRTVLASPQFSALALKALRWLESRPWAEGGDSLPNFGVQALRRLHTKVLEASIDDAKSRHALRIRVKRLRYACEFFAPCFPAQAMRTYLARLEALQDILGDLNDIAVARTLYGEIEVPVPPALDRRKAALLTKLRRAWGQFQRTNTSSFGQTSSR